MTLLSIAAAALLALQAQAAEAAPSDSLVERFLAVLPDRDEISALSTEIDSGELAGLVALNPGKEAQIRPILQANLACTGPAISAGTLRMLRKVAQGLGEARLQRLVRFYEGPDYAAFRSLAGRMEGNAAPRPEDEAAMAKLMEAYPLKAFYEEMSHAEEIFAADQGFMSAAMKCASEQMAALEAAGLKSH
jgi:hypothetical protein